MPGKNKWHWAKYWEDSLWNTTKARNYNKITDNHPLIPITTGKGSITLQKDNCDTH